MLSLLTLLCCVLWFCTYCWAVSILPALSFQFQEQAPRNHYISFEILKGLVWFGFFNNTFWSGHVAADF